MKYAALALILILAGSAFAGDFPAGMKLFGYYAVPQGAGFSVANFTHHNATLYAIVSGTEVYSILKTDFPYIMPKALTDRGEIGSALASYYISSGNAPVSLSDLAPIHAGLESVKDARRAGEADCKRLAGTDRTACTDYESCLKACVSVTSFCQNFMYGGAPGDFIRVIWQFENNTRDLDAAYAEENASYRAVAANTTKERISAYLDSVSALNREAASASQSTLFSDYSFCYSPDYSLPVITNLQLSLQKRWKAAQPYYAIGEAAVSIQNRTLAAIAAQERFELPAPSQSPSPNGTNETAKEAQYEKDKSDFFINSILLPAAGVFAAVVVAGALLLAYAFWVRKHK